MKNFVFTLLIILSCNCAQAQLQATLNVDSNPTPELSEWVNRNNLAILTVTNSNPGVIIEYQIKASLLLDGDVKVTTDNTVPFITSDLGTETFLADEIIPYTAVQFIDSRFRDRLSRTGMLPPGAYSFCIELLGRDGRPLTRPEQICRPMIITDYQMPELLNPVDNKFIDPLLISSLMFQWTPLVPVPDAMTGSSYIIAVSEVQPGQTPSQAFTVNYPIIEEEITVGTQYVWPIDLPAPEEDRQYVWGIKPMTSEGNTYRAQNNGFVDIGVFTVGGTNKSSVDDEGPVNDRSFDNNKDNPDNDTSGLDEVGNDNTSSKEPSDIIPTSLDCENVDIEALENLFIYQAMFPENPETLVILGLDAMRLNYMSQILGAIDTENYVVTSHINWGDVNTYDTSFIQSTTADHNYLDWTMSSNYTIPSEVCIILNIRDKLNPEINCTVTVCKDIPKKQMNAISNSIKQEEYEFEKKNSECKCLDKSSVVIPDLTIEYAVNDDGDQHTLTIPDSATALQSIVDCMTTQELFDGMENMDGHPEYNYQSQFFTSTVTHDWHLPDAMADPSNSHTYTVLSDDDEPMPQFINVTFHIVNTNADIDCYFVQEVPVPHDAYDAINGVEECECDEEMVEPELTLLQADAAMDPRELLVGGVIPYRDYLLNCNSNYSLSTHAIDVTINWQPDEDGESIVNSGPFTHTYDGIDDLIPDEICVTFSITPLFPSSEGQACTTVKCLPVPDAWQDLNIEAGTGELAVGDEIYSGTKVDGLGEFVSTVTSLSGDPGGPYTGTATTYVDWLKSDIHTEFTDITIDSLSNLVTGMITGQVHDTAPVYPLAWVIGMAGGINMTHPQTENIFDFINANSDQEIDYDPASGAVMPVKMPLGVNFDSGDQLAITEMAFRADESEFNLVAAKATPEEWGPTQRVGFLAKNIKHHPAEPVWPPERLELLEDIEIGNVNGKITFEFKAPTVDNPGCYIEWGSLGVTNYGIELDVHFTREWLIPAVDDDGVKRSSANLVASGANWDGMVLTGQLEESVIASTVPDATSGAPSDTGAHDFIILVDDISYDWSDTMNAPAMAFPPIYTGETTNLFHGFHMEELTVKFSPNKMNTPTGDPIEVSINDMIIDDTGITLEAEVENLVAFGGAEVADMVASIDRVYLEILSSNFVEAGVEGRIAIPVNEGNGLDNSLAYTALFNNPLDPALNNNFQLVLEPDQPIQNDLFGGGEFTLDDTSNLTGYFDKDKKTFTLDLNGDFAWEDATVGPIDQINMELGFEGLGFDYDSSLATNKLTFDEGNWAFASPQKKVANFPVTIEEIGFSQVPTTGDELMRGKLKFDLVFNLSDKIGGRSTLGIEGAIEDTKSSGGKTFDPELKGVVIDSISVSADLAAVKIDGFIGFRNNDPIYGNGFIGTLDAEFKAGGIKIGALAEFGNTTYNHTNAYRYWRVEADATFPAPGITFLPGMAFRGFGGGAFRNMIATPSGSSFNFTPDYDELGFRASAILATTPKEETFNADVGLLAAFSGSGGMTNIAFTGDFFVGASIADRSKAKIDGDVGVSYNFPDKKFVMSANVNVNAPPITTPAPASLILDIDGKTNEWFFKFGEPNNLNTVNVFGISLYEYLMFGNTIPYPGGFTSTFTNGYYSAIGNYPSAGTTATGGVGSTTEQGKGFAMGIGFTFDEDGEYNITEFNNGNKKHVLNWDLAAGAELHLSYMQYVGSCGGYTPLGINGYRAKGGLGMYGTAAAGVTRYRSNGNVKWNINLASIKAGAWITGEFPKPVYAAGAVEGEVGLFDDLLSFSFYQAFEYGISCGNGGASTGPAVTQGDAAADQQNALITYVKASPIHEFPIEQPLIAKYGLTPNAVFDVSEQQTNGTVEMRTFKMVTTTNLEIKNETTGAWETIGITSSQNNMSEYLYVTGNPIVSASAGASVLALSGTPPSLGGLGVAPPAPSYASSSALGISGSSSPSSGSAMAAPSALVSYPPPAPSSDYDDLPPDPDPVVNSLEDDRDYRFTVTATLKEYNGASWTTALKNNGSPVTQTIVKIFSTGPMTGLTAGAATF